MDDNCPNFMDNRNDERMMDAFILFVLPPLFGFGIYWLMKHDFVQFMIGYIKKRIGEKDERSE